MRFYGYWIAEQFRLPSEFDLWNSIYKKFRTWIEQEVFEKILQALAADCKNYYLVEMKSPARSRSEKILGNQDIGVSRGGKTTFTLSPAENFQLISLSGGNIPDSLP